MQEGQINFSLGLSTNLGENWIIDAFLRWPDYRKKKGKRDYRGQTNAMCETHAPAKCQPTLISENFGGLVGYGPYEHAHHYNPTCHGYSSLIDMKGSLQPVPKRLFVFPRIVNWCAHSSRSRPCWAHFILPSSMILPSAAVGQDPFRPRPVNCLLVYFNHFPRNASKSIISTFITITIYFEWMKSLRNQKLIRYFG